MDFLLHGTGEPLKREVHTAAKVLCGVMWGYNAASFLYRGMTGRGWQKHLAANAAIYGTGYWWEARKADQHR